MSTEKLLEPSDEEILEAPSEDSDFDDVDDEEGNSPLANAQDGLDELSGSEVSRSPSPDLDAEGWGASRQDYYNADIIETEADALEEEKEARRLQQKQLQQMTEADYGFDEVDWTTAGKSGTAVAQGTNTIRQKLPTLEISDDMSIEERTRILRTNYPEFEPLAREFSGLRTQFEELVLDLGQGPSKHVQQIISIKHRALGGYLSALCLYFAIFSSGIESREGKAAPLPPSELREHPIMETLVACRTQWEKVKNLTIPENDDASISAEEEEDMPLAPIEVPNDTVQITEGLRKGDKTAKACDAAAESARRRKQRLAAIDKDLASLSALTSPSHTPKMARTLQNGNASDSSDFGDPTSLSAREAAAKASRKKSLKFYTAQIAGKASRRDNATKSAGGDEDLPYRERLRDRQERLTKAAQGKAQDKGADLGDGDSSEDEATAKAIRDDVDAGEDEDDYYDFISRKAADKKAAKAAAAAATSTDSRILDPRYTNDTGRADGAKRGITYAIEKNKGLAPKRKKEVRNPRVKKRKKYEEKQKRLKSIRPVYKPEREGKGGYGGEMTGIKRGVVRSVKL